MRTAASSADFRSMILGLSSTGASRVQERARSVLDSFGEGRQTQIVTVKVLLSYLPFSKDEHDPGSFGRPGAAKPMGVFDLVLNSA